MEYSPQNPIYTCLLIELYFYRADMPETAMTPRTSNPQRSRLRRAGFLNRPAGSGLGTPPCLI